MLDPSTARCLLLDNPLQPAWWRWDTEVDAMPHTIVTAVDREDSPARRADTASPEESTTDSVLRQVAARFARIVAEALSGKRRFTQLEPWFDASSLSVLANRFANLGGADVRLASVRVQSLAPESAEVTLRLSTPGLDHAAALRITRRHGRWACTDLVIP